MVDRDRGRDDADDNLDEVLDDADADEGVEEPVSRGGTATRSRTRDADRRAKRDSDSVGVFGRISRFVREVVAELRKVIWPTRNELLTYTAVVIVFLAVMLAVVSLLDLGFAKVILWVFGSGDTGDVE